MPEEEQAKQDAAEAAEDNVISESVKLPPTLQLLPARHTKTLHLVRHGEGYHNVAGKQGYHMYKSRDYFDAHLTEFGWQQASQLSDFVDKNKIKRLVDVVIVSPLSRALETAVGAFGGPEKSAEDSSLLMRPLTAEEGKCPKHAAVSSEGVPPFVAWEGCREHLGVHPCDQRRPLSYLKRQFPGVDFSTIKEEEDALWKADERESTRELTQRGVDFLQWLMQRPEQSIAVVTHSSFLLHMLSACGLNTEPPVKEELQAWYANCEMRTVVLSTTGGADLPDTKHFPGYRISHEHAAVTQGTIAMQLK